MSRSLQHIPHILQVPVTFFFEGLPPVPGTTDEMGAAPSPEYVSEFLATADGLSLTKSFVQIKSARLRSAIVNLVEQIADDDD